LLSLRVRPDHGTPRFPRMVSCASLAAGPNSLAQFFASAHTFEPMASSARPGFLPRLLPRGALPHVARRGCARAPRTPAAAHVRRARAPSRRRAARQIRATRRLRPVQLPAATSTVQPHQARATAQARDRQWCRFDGSTNWANAHHPSRATTPASASFFGSDNRRRRSPRSGDRRPAPRRRRSRERAQRTKRPRPRTLLEASSFVNGTVARSSARVFRRSRMKGRRLPSSRPSELDRDQVFARHLLPHARTDVSHQAVA
jgi:hypothetical protein